MRSWRSRKSERQSGVPWPRARALWDVAFALTPLLILLGVHRWLSWLTRPAKENA